MLDERYVIDVLVWIWGGGGDTITKRNSVLREWAKRPSGGRVLEGGIPPPTVGGLFKN